MDSSPTIDLDSLARTPASRREFLGQLATTAAALATAGCAAQVSAATSGAASPVAPVAAPPAAPRKPLAPDHWDDSWTTRLTSHHKAVFDCAAIEYGEAVGHAFSYITGLHDALGVPNDQVQTVLVIRHAAIPMALNDAMWAKYDIGKETRIKDGKQWAVRNPYLMPDPGRPAAKDDAPDYTLSWLPRHGHTLLGCNRALLGTAYQIADRTKGDHSTIYHELAANLIPGLILQPSGIYATLRAQEAGCLFFKST